MSKKMNRVLALLLCLCLLLTGVPGMAAPADGAGGPAEDDPSTQDLDPAALGVHKLGELSGDETPPDLSGVTPDTSLKELVRVSIFLSEPSAIDAGYAAQGIGRNQSAVSYRTSLLNRQKSVQASIESKVGYSLDVAWNLTLLTNAFSTWVYGKDIPVIERMDGVIAVQRENMYTVPVTESGAQPDTANTSTGMVGASEAWADGYTGAGTRIAVIDTGIDTAHISFDADAFDYAIAAYERQSGRSVDLMDASDIPAGLNGAGTYLTSKIPYAYNYVDGNMTVNHLSDRQGEHGSHVAGIAAANRYVKKGSSFVDASQAVHAVGMAPDAQLLIMKVFGAGGGAYDSDYIAAIEDAVALDADAVNLSLGGAAPGFTYDNAYQGVLNSLSDGTANAGTVASVSAGNSGSFLSYSELTYVNDPYIDDVSTHTGGSPGTYINSLCVASADNTGKTGAPLVFNGKQNVFISDSPSSGGSFADLSGTYDFVYIDASGTWQDYYVVNEEVSLAGKVVIVNRGIYNFSDKGNNAISFSPAALIIANNERGSLNMALDDFTGTFPLAGMSLADAEALKAASACTVSYGLTYYTGTVKVTTAITHGGTADRSEANISDFSSWGVPGSLLMKPEITAPGGDIYSVFGTSYSPAGAAQGGADQYELLSGTSMAAPHIAGLAALTAQYLKEADYEALNPGLANYSRRAVIQSLLMSTATPMVDADGYYYSILQQGAGLADVSRAVNASSVIMMKDAGLTTATRAAADGKVKAELGDDPDRTGVFSYSFTVYNLSGRDLTFNLRTDLFTQSMYEGVYDFIFMDRSTKDLDVRTTYSFVQELKEPHDVNRDGVTNEDDAQAVLDVLSGEDSGSGFDLTAGEMDGDGLLSTHDASLLLQYGEAAAGSLTVKAGSARDVTVKIAINGKAREYLDDNYPNGTYVEGYTYVECTTASAEGAAVGDVHSIPILGFYGSWTDPSMFDNTSYTDRQYDTLYSQKNYSGNGETNYLILKYGSQLAYFMGNPYTVERDGFPSDVLAVNSRDPFVNLYYNLIRSAGTTGFAVSRTDGIGGDVTEVLDLSACRQNVDGLYYDVNAGYWENTGTKVHAINRTAASYGLQEGDTFRIGYYAIPEYYAMLAHSGDMTAENAGVLSDEEFNSLLKGNVLGRGAFVGYDFTVDDTAPVIGSIELDGTNLLVTAGDNQALAYLAVLSLDGKTEYRSAVPHDATFSGVFDLAYAVENAEGYVAVFAADYAGNETAKAFRVNDREAADPLAIDTIAVVPGTLNLYTGSEADLSVSVTPVTVEDRSVTWASSNRSVATVDENGHVTAVAAGRAVITATAVADRTKSATCTVNVVSINKTLYGIVWDEEGEVFFSSFNTTDPSAWQREHTEGVPYPVQTTLMTNHGTYAGTFDANSGTTMLYSFDPYMYELSEFGENYIGATDFAAASSYYPEYIGTVYTFLPYLIAGGVIADDPDPTDDVEEDYMGIPYAIMDVTQTSVNAYLAAVATKERRQEGGDFFLLDENGRIWETTLSYNWNYDGTNLPFEFSDPVLVLDTGIPTSFLYQDLYYDGTWLYWSHCADNGSTLYAIDTENGILYDTGSFGDGVWPVTGLYVQGRVAPASAGDEEEIGPLPAEPLNIRREDLMTAEVMSRLAAESARSPAGSLTSVRVSEQPFAREEKETETVGRSSQATDNKDRSIVILTDDEAVTNGLMTVSYSEGLSYLNSESPAFYSTHVDEAARTVTFAYASVAEIPAEEPIARIYFELTEPDRMQQVTIGVTERNTDTRVSEEPVTIQVGRPVFRSQALVLSGEIAVKFNMELPPIDGVDYADSYMRSIVGNSNVWAQMPISQATVDSNGRYGFLSYVKSIQMADTIHAEFIYGGTRNVYKNYSVERYIKAMDEHQDQFDARTMDLIHAIADYGHYAQLYLSEVNGWAIGTDYKAMNTFYTDSYDYADILSKVTPKAFVKTIDGTSITKATYKLHLDAETTVDVYLTTKDGSAPKNVKLTMPDKKSGKDITSSVTPLETSDGRYMIQIEGISAHQLGDMITITGEAGGKFTVQVCALSYVRSVLNNSSSTKAAKDGMASLYAYYAATMAYRQKSST